VITKKGEVKDATVKAGGGSYRTGYAGASGETPVKDGGVAGAVRYSDSAGWLLSAKDERRVSGSLNQRAEDAGLSMASHYKDWSLSGLYAGSRRRVLGLIPWWPSDPENMTKGMFDAGYKHAITEDWSAGANVTYNYSRLDSPSTGSIAANTDGTSVLTEATIQGSPLRDVNVVLGGSGDFQEFVNDPVGTHASQTWWNSYAQADYRPVSRLKLIGGCSTTRRRSPPPIILRATARS